jgi:hypothetical protein
MTSDGLTGTAVSDTDGNNTIQNNGFLVGSLALGTGKSDLTNTKGYVAGTVLGLGTGTFTNLGQFSVGGTSNVGVTSLTGSFVQLPGADSLVDLDLNRIVADQLDLNAVASIGGNVDLTLLNIPTALPGTYKFDLVTAQGGLTAPNVILNAPVSAIATYALSTVNNTDLQLTWTINFSPHFGPDGDSLGYSRSMFGNYLSTIQTAGSNAAFGALVQSIFAIPDGPTLANLYSHLSPGSLAPIEFTTLTSSEQFAGKMMSCGYIASSCEWGSLDSFALNQSVTANTVGVASLGAGFNYGSEQAIGHGYSLGAGIQYEDHSMTLNGGVASASGDLLQGGMFLAHRTAHGTSMSFGMTYGWEDDTTTRQVLYPGPTAVSLGRLESSIIGTHLRLTHEYDRSTTAFTPYIDLGATRINLMDDPEHGSAGFLTANITGHGDTFTAAQTGITIDPRAGIGNTGFAPSLRLGMIQYLGNPQTTITGTLLGAPVGVPQFNLPSQFDRSAFDIAPSLSLNARPGQMNVRLSGDYHVSGRSQGLTASINLEQRF